jgi:SAM-dependent methyltransferase
MDASLYNDEYFDRTDRWSQRPKYYEELEMLLSHVPLNAASRVLDVGCNTGRGIARIGSRFGCDVVGLDYPEAWMGKCKVPAAVRGDGHVLPFRDSAFDAVFLLHVIGHVESPHKVVSEAYRVLKTGGSLALLTPNGRFVRMMRILDHLGIQHHTPDPTVLRLYRKEDLRFLFHELPWNVEECFTFGKLPHMLQLVQFFGLPLHRFQERICCVARKP